MRTRKALQEIQVSAINDPNCLGTSKMSSELTQSKANDKKAKKPVGRPKRKTAAVNSTSKKTSKEETSNQPVTCFSNIENKKENFTDSGLEQSVILNQARIETFLTPGPIKKPQKLISEDEGNSSLSKSIIEGIALITSESPSEGYWKEIAETRRQALEKALLENELLTDQFSVLQTENQLLKNALEAAEKLLKMEGLMD